MQRSSFLLLFLGLVVVLAFHFNLLGSLDLNKLIYYSPCDYPIHYSIGSIDPRFNVSKDTLLADIKQATNVWNQAEQKNLFSYDDQNSIKISLIYDERQSLHNQIGQIESQLYDGKSTLEPKISEYQQRVAAFKQKLANLNNEINYWNSQGGAPPEEFKKLVTQQQQVQQEANELNSLAKTLNQSTESYNSLVGQFNQTVGDFNTTLQQKPEGGLYDPQNQEISIYFADNKPELIHTLAHEMGHALGVGHNQNPNSVMYPYTNTKTTLSTTDLAELQTVCQKQSIFTIAQTKATTLFDFYLKQYTQKN